MNPLPRNRDAQVVIVGTATLDVLHLWNSDRTQQHLQIGFGGVCKNVACALGSLGVGTRFVSVKVSGELGSSVKNYLHDHGVEWVTVDAGCSLPLFQADIDPDGHVSNETLLDPSSLDRLTPELLRGQLVAFCGARLIVTCTDLSIEAIDELIQIASEQSLHLWLLSSSWKEVDKIRKLGKRVQLVGLNVVEAEALAGRRFDTLLQVASFGKEIVAKDGSCLITLGGKGALLCQEGDKRVFYQPVVPVLGRSTVGAGDVLFAAVLACRLGGKNWGVALQHATDITQQFIVRDPETELPYNNLRPGRYPLPALECLIVD